jgi:hypothetical protein
MKATMKLFLLSALIVCIIGCKHEDHVSIGGKGGGATVNVYPQHHTVASKLINFKVYVKYNTQDAPTNGVYDDSLACINSNNLVSCSFTGLNNGLYYFYSSGYDTSIAQNVKGGIPYTITAQKEQNLNLPVSE